VASKEEHEMNHGTSLWDEHLERLGRLFGTRPSAASFRATCSAAVGDGQAHEARRREWAAPPPGRLGRRLIADIEPYLEFFATAQA
jgi:hypothetical protein